MRPLYGLDYDKIRLQMGGYVRKQDGGQMPPDPSQGQSQGQPQGQPQGPPPQQGPPMPQDQGAPPDQGQPQGGGNPVMDMLKAYFQANQFTPQQIQQFIADFQKLPDDQKQQVLQHIQQTMQGGDQSQQEPQDQQQPQDQQGPPQGPPQDQQMQVPQQQQQTLNMPQQTGGYNNTYSGSNYGLSTTNSLTTDTRGVLPIMYQGADNLQTQYESGIHLNPNNKGDFTSKANSHGMGVQEFAGHVLANKDSFNTNTIQQANFAKNAKSFKHQGGGIYQMGEKYLTDQNGYTDPNMQNSQDVVSSIPMKMLSNVTSQNQQERLPMFKGVGADVPIPNFDSSDWSHTNTPPNNSNTQDIRGYHKAIDKAVDNSIKDSQGVMSDVKDVMAIQKALNDKDHAGLAEDGKFGKNTLNAVKAYKASKNNIDSSEVDGVVDSKMLEDLGLKDTVKRKQYESYIPNAKNNDKLDYLGMENGEKVFTKNGKKVNKNGERIDKFGTIISNDQYLPMEKPAYFGDDAIKFNNTKQRYETESGKSLSKEEESQVTSAKRSTYGQSLYDANTKTPIGTKIEELKRDNTKNNKEGYIGDDDYYSNMNKQNKKMFNTYTSRSGDIIQGNQDQPSNYFVSTNKKLDGDLLVYDKKNNNFLIRDLMGQYSKPNKTQLEDYLGTEEGIGFLKNIKK